ncbi:AGAP013096-PA-like protein [Anopheles sinensis]|uniref:AGAP013096-PA-like protein n=1 Tax=Anopheles sinensis TaxID=74873 RepID=A0A084VTI6_ANOSI|nr:AGAP013096-PA-like protein [Anopheles sinensis]
MAMAACYPTYDHMTGGSTNVGSVQQLQQQQQSPVAATSQLHHLSSRLSAAAAAAAVAAAASSSRSVPQDFSIPLHVDCSVEYELPNQAKPPVGARVEPLLMIHPCYFRKMESQRRSPFVNNMPNSSRSSGGGPRGWGDIEKTSMAAAVPRDFQAGPESLPLKAGVMAAANLPPLFTPLMTAAFPPMQQVSCYNV